MSLMNGPGESTFTRTFHCAHSCAWLLVRLMSAALDAPYAQTRPPPEYPAIEAMLTMLPPPCAFMWGSTHCDVRNGPSTLTEKILRHTATSISAGPSRAGVIPALF